jgi:hypothetical protein
MKCEPSGSRALIACYSRFLNVDRMARDGNHMITPLLTVELGKLGFSPKERAALNVPTATNAD